MLVEFGPEMDVSIRSESYGRIEKVSFDACNERGNLIEVVERYRERTGVYRYAYWQIKYIGGKRTGHTIGKES